MSNLPDRSTLRADPAWRYPVLLGALSIPFTLALNWGAPNTLGIEPVFVAALLAGFVVDGERPVPTHAGFRTGLVGSIGLVPTIFATADLQAVPSPSFWVVAALLTFLIAAIFVAVTGMVGALGGEIGNWLSERIDADPSRWITN